jgi:signal transduction histidine kinase
VSQVLQFSRPRPAQLDPVDVGSVITSTAVFLRNLQAADGIDVRVVTHGDTTVLGDVDQLEQVLLNLSLNAVQALGHEGILALAARRDGDSVVLEVADSGPGIPEAVRAEVFKPFFTTKTTGTGLGLAICARIVADHGGQIGFDCPPEGGTCFSVRLPGAH